jgi:hypothetical protein
VKFFSKKTVGKTLVTSSVIGSSISSANAAILDDAFGAFFILESDVKVVGGYVLLATTAVVAVTIILGLVRKA